MELSSSGSEQKATAYAFSPPSATPVTHNFFGQPSFLMMETSTSNTNASEYPDTKTTHSRSAQNPRSDIAQKTTTPQHLPMPHQWNSHQKDTPQQDTPPLRKQQNLQECLNQWKNQRHDQQQRIATANATGVQSNNWTKAQQQCVAAFRSYHRIWLSRRSRNTELATAAHFRQTSASMALYLFTIHPALFKIATAALAAKGKQGPKPLTSIHALLRSKNLKVRLAQGILWW